MRKMIICFAGFLLAAGCATTSQDLTAPTPTGTATHAVAVIPIPPSVQSPVAPPPSDSPAQPPATAKPAVTPEVTASPVSSVDKPAVKPAQETKIQNAAMGAIVTASSTNKKFPSELPPSALVDGDLTTRWSSEYTEPQTVEMKLAKPMRIGKIRIHWENAVATKYALSVSSDGKSWKGMYAYMKTDAEPEPRVDEINLNNVSASYVKLDLISRVKPEWGFSLYEVEVIPAE